ncbi:hypothetical protein LC087_17810 [Bacillus carboniphilus]|uniref:Uncharacterized protein n=1 Tax=Bacillus carboniphilus TaxID=86663 RepID=A0ABY9JT36_9BACI|nr:hypothetical protein [Bacillus carboniphilus]WLR42522.1 hypothetical protein LC087_17810 [Bacillus carboniphilus]
MKYLLVFLFSVFSFTILFSGCSSQNETEEPNSQSEENQVSDETSPSFSEGSGEVTDANIYTCQNANNSRDSAIGTVTSEEGEIWNVPIQPNEELEDASDLYNECTGTIFPSIEDLDVNDIPIIEIDEDGEVITGYIFADNYFELYINGQPVAKDAVPFTPFNSHVVRFKASYPITYAIKAVDWEENIGLGTENNRGSDYHPGDAGIIAVFSDGTTTSESWLAQSFYISPLTNKDDLVITEDNNGKITHETPDFNKVTCTTDCYAAHFSLDENWYAKDFDDSSFPHAVTYTTDEIGVDNKKAYMNYENLFSKGQFVWTKNLVYDNVIILRHTVDEPSQ